MTDNQIAIEGLTQGTNLCLPGATDNQMAIEGLTQGPNLRATSLPGVTDNQIAIESLTQGTNLRTSLGTSLSVGREGQAYRSHYC